jgi:ribosomal protein S19
MAEENNLEQLNKIEHDMDTAELNKKKRGAKSYSLASMIIAGLWIGVLTILKGFKFIELDVTEEIIPSGIMLAGVFSPVYISIILDKIKEIRIGKE